MKADFYLKHFQFRERPFALLPDPDFIFWSRGHSRAFSVLEYGLMTQAPITVLTGEVGAGKTTLLRALMSDIEQDVVVGLISNAQGGRGDLLRWVLNAFDQPVEPNSDYVILYQQFVDFVLAQYAAGLSVLLVIDEAQNLSPETLEELRMLTNVNSGKDELLQLVLLGQPELREVISRPELRQFAQRVSVSYHLEPMDLQTTCDYVQSRLQHAGGTGDEFTKSALTVIHRVSGGIPREINKICDLALVYAVSADTTTIDQDLVDELLRDGVILTAPAVPFSLSSRYAVVPRSVSGEAAE